MIFYSGLGDISKTKHTQKGEKMALIKCTECGKKISDKATNCPNCGCPIITTEIKQSESQKKVKKGGCLKAILIYLGIGMVISIIIAIRSQKEPTKTQPVLQTSSESQTQTDELEEDTKENARTIDEKLWEYVLPIINANNQLMKIIGNESSTNLDIYNAANNFKEMCRQAWGNPPEVSGNGADEYLNSCRDYILIEQTMADSLLTYINSGKTSDLSKAQENIKSCTQAVTILATNKGVFLSQNGFTNEEIQEIDLGIEE